jgi:hypothetical protein
MNNRQIEASVNAVLATITVEDCYWADVRSDFHEDHVLDLMPIRWIEDRTVVGRAWRNRFRALVQAKAETYAPGVKLGSDAR